MELSLESQILNLVREPKILLEISKEVNKNSRVVKGVLNDLLFSNKIKIIDRLHISNRSPIPVYISVNKDTYGACVICKEVIPKQLITGSKCQECYIEEGEENIHPYTPSSIIVNHLQSIINEQKQLIYLLKMENYILKKGML